MFVSPTLRPLVKCIGVMRFTTCAASCVVLALVLVGCGDSSEALSVSGKVMYGGEPLPNGAITFFPARGRPATAPISAEGDYAIALPPGEYVVVINVSADLPSGFKEGDPLPPPKIVLPPQYTTRARSTLTATVTEDQPRIDFELPPSQ